MCGIGGRTVEEAKQNLTYEEFLMWSQYRKLRGPMNPMLRSDRGHALTASAMSGVSIDKLMPWAKDEQENEVPTEEQIEKAPELTPDLFKVMAGVKKEKEILPGQKFKRRFSKKRNNTNNTNNKNNEFTTKEKPNTIDIQVGGKFRRRDT